MCDSGYQEIIEAKDSLDLFYSAQWKWKQQDNILFVYGLDLQSQTSTTKNSWEFLQTNTALGTGSTFYIEHPATKNFYPILRSDIRLEDGWLGFQSQNLRIRYHYLPQSSLLSVTLRVNGQPLNARRTTIYNSLDAKALWVGISRKENELNGTLAEALIKCGRYRGQTKRGAEAWLSSALRTSTRLSLNSSTTGFTYTNNYFILNHNKVSYEQEYIDQDHRTFYNSPDYGQLFLGNVYVDFTLSSSGLSIPAYTTNSSKLKATWKINYWDDSNHTVIFNSNYDKQAVEYLVTSKVNIDIADQVKLADNFNQKSPLLRWQRVFPNTRLSGLAVFDF